MSGPVLLYKATDNAKLDDWDAELVERFAQFLEARAALCTEIGVTTLLNRRNNSGGQTITGYVAENYDDKPLPGFRREPGSDHMVPALRTKLGKEWKEKLSAVNYIRPKAPGLPGLVWGGGYVGHFQVEKLDGKWFAWLGFNPHESYGRNHEVDSIDADLWQEAKFSEYYSAQETEADQ